MPFPSTIDAVRGTLESLLDPLLPSLCALCAGAAPRGSLLCATCEREICGPAGGISLRVPACDGGWAASPYEGAARKLVAALKFSGRLRLAEVAAEQIARRAPPGFLDGCLVPVPAAAWRRMWRGFDPAERIALALARRTGLAFAPCLGRSTGPRQVGRGRAARLADPPRVRATAAVPARAVLVDDVITTGATVRACARALRGAGCERVVALSFAATP